MDMGTALVSLVEYLDTAYAPDREYVDGAIVERHVGERTHSLAQKKVVIYLQTSYPRLFVWPEQRVVTVPGRRSRVPDVCVTLEDPRTEVFEAPPLIVIEILSRRDEMSDVLEKLEEYAGFQAPHIWVADPRRKKGFRFREGRLEEVEAEFVVESSEIRLPLEEVFRGV
jgi:Uma2 family endonuclease